MKVLIFGASGFIGRPTAQAFLRAGHTVIGQTRSEKSALILQAEEVVPLVADPKDTSTWRHIIKSVDVVIDTVGGMDIKAISELIAQVVVEEAARSRPNGPPLTFIYSSGTWVHGDSLDDLHGHHSDLTPLVTPNELTAWRLPHEQAHLAARSASLAPIVVRPGLVYGKSASITAEWFQSAKAGEVIFQGSPDARIATVHVEDCARLFLAAAEKALLVQGLIFDGTNPYPEPISHILTQLAKVSGAAGPRYVPVEDLFHRATASSNLSRPSLARDLLGWEPRKAPMGEGMEVYYKAWLASVGN